jgi:putative membrane protein
VLARWGIRLLTSLAGIAVGIVVSATLLDDFSIDAGALVVATVLFWIIHLAVQFIALRVLIRQPSVALAGLLALASTIVALIIVNIIVSGMSIHGISTYVLATLIIWLATVGGDVVGHRRIQARRQERRSA